MRKTISVTLSLVTFILLLLAAVSWYQRREKPSLEITVQNLHPSPLHVRFAYSSDSANRYSEKHYTVDTMFYKAQQVDYSVVEISSLRILDSGFKENAENRTAIREYFSGLFDSGIRYSRPILVQWMDSHNGQRMVYSQTTEPMQRAIRSQIQITWDILKKRGSGPKYFTMSSAAITGEEPGNKYTQLRNFAGNIFTALSEWEKKVPENGLSLVLRPVSGNNTLAWEDVRSVKNQILGLNAAYGYPIKNLDKKIVFGLNTSGEWEHFLDIRKEARVDAHAITDYVDKNFSGYRGETVFLFASGYHSGKKWSNVPYTGVDNYESMYNQLQFAAAFYRGFTVSKPVVVLDFPTDEKYPILHAFFHPLLKKDGIYYNPRGASNEEIKISRDVLEYTLSGP